MAASIPKPTNGPPVLQPSLNTELSKNTTRDGTPAPKKSSLDGIRTILRKRNVTSNTLSGQNMAIVNKAPQIAPHLEQPQKASVSLSSHPVDPGAFENLVDNVGAMSMSPDDDIQMQDDRADQDTPSLVLVATDVQDTRISAPEHLDDVSSAEEVDDLLRKNTQSGSVQSESSPSSGDEDSLDLTYPVPVEVSSS